MTKKRMLSFIDIPSPVHSLTGASKLIIFLLWSILIMVTFKTPILIILSVLGIFIFRVSKIKFKDISFIIKMMVFFLVLNLVAIYLFAPEQGVLIYKSRHVIWEGQTRFTITWEQLFYEFNVFLKYITIIPPALLLIVTTHPSEFAASLNRIGVPYTVAYSVSLTLRYIPDVQRDFEAIYQAQQARGLELSKKASPLKRMKRTVPLLLPLIFSSLERIDIISRAMELRGFGKNNKRTWYSQKPFKKIDIVSLVISIIIFTVGIIYTFHDGNRFYFPIEFFSQ
jgi:energy-coupling factor transport system permease protein